MIARSTYDDNNANVICSKATTIKIPTTHIHNHRNHTLILIQCIQHIFISNNHWILVQIHASIRDLYHKIYDSNTLTMKKLPNDTMQLFIKELMLDAYYMHMQISCNNWMDLLMGFLQYHMQLI
jgi:hypothetical protein